ncbi:MAG TPA: neuraminidase-like domain-containing protein [Saprospiraceae bacterium]|nr:neuraminidase-like domain-containing protein [Saprospiraceae bacterium]
MTTDTTETAFHNYLEKLGTVSRLEICGMYLEVEAEEEVNILHVFGRTNNIPHIYYYRRWVDKSYWTAWEQVDLDIQGDHLIPVVWNRQLYLFWPIFTEKAEVSLPGSPDETPTEPTKHWEIQMAWSEYKNKKWGTKKTSTEVNIVHLPPISYSFKGLFIGDKLVIRCYKLESIIAFPIGEFQFLGDKIAMHNNDLIEESWNIYPIGSHLEGMRFVENSLHHPDDKLYVFDVRYPNEGYLPPLELDSARRNVVLLNQTPGIYHIIPPHQDPQFNTLHPFFYEDEKRTFFINLKFIGEEVDDVFGARERHYLEFHTFYHPYVQEIIKILNQQGIEGLFSRGALENRGLQYLSQDVFSDSFYDPQPSVVGYPIDDVDIEPIGAYSLYNWEMFFHAPLLIADRLSKNQRFEEAQKWFHYIFDPTDRSTDASPQRYWKFRQFYENAQKDIETLQDLLNDAAKIETQVKEWRKHPFNPHLIARMRTTAYQKTVVMKYIDNLIAWGDQLFRRDTIESINEASLLYILAAQILGPKPIKLPAQSVAPITFRQADNFDALSNPEVENIVVLMGEPNGVLGNDYLNQEFLNIDLPIGQATPAYFATSRYFCFPPNDKLLAYWDTVADRLFKIRHCMNIEGAIRQLPLFEPPIDPALLVRAAAAGLDISSVLNEINLTLPHYRFNMMLQKATELCTDVKSFGALLLSVLEKKDIESLTLIRSSHELTLLKSIVDIKLKQIAEAKASKDALNKSMDLTCTRYKDYMRRLGQPDAKCPAQGADVELNSTGSLESTFIKREKAHLDRLYEANTDQRRVAIIEKNAIWASAFPNLTVGLSGWGASPVATAQTGGNLLVMHYQSEARSKAYKIASLTYDATEASIMAGHERRQEEWQLLATLAFKETLQIEKQIVAADIRIQIAEKELENHNKQIENAQAIDDFLKSKFTKQDLYDWMVGQVSGVFFQSYQLVYDVAKRAEHAYRHELGLTDSNFIQFGYWDSLKKGLLAGERLAQDLRRMEIAYLDQNRRELEITKHISLRQLNPLALIMLRETGQCDINIPETLFDLDFPGHYMRRIKSVSVSIPCVIGPYGSVNATLTLQNHSIRGEELRTWPVSAQSIVTSHAQNDSGMFELNFRDERYLPFEGYGAISSWQLELSGKWTDPQGHIVDMSQFNFDTISDVILHLRYTARDGGAEFKKTAQSDLQETIAIAASDPQYRLFSLRHEFPAEWHQLLYPASGSAQTTMFELSSQHFPYLLANRTLGLNKATLFLKPTGLEAVNTEGLTIVMKGVEPTNWSTNILINGSSVPTIISNSDFALSGNPIGPWPIEVTQGNLDRAALEDILLLLEYGA